MTGSFSLTTAVSMRHARARLSFSITCLILHDTNDFVEASSSIYSLLLPFFLFMKSCTLQTFDIYTIGLRRFFKGSCIIQLLSCAHILTRAEHWGRKIQIFGTEHFEARMFFRETHLWVARATDTTYDCGACHVTFFFFFLV